MTTKSFINHRVLWLLIPLLTLFNLSAWGTETTYLFTNSSWNATCGGSSANWTNNDAGDGYGNNGVQILGSGTGVATSPSSFTNVTKVVVTYNTNKGGGSGTIKIKIGTNSEVSNSAAWVSGDDGRTKNYKSTFNFSPAQSGSVKLSVVGSTNSLYIVSIAITEASDPYTVKFNTGTGNPSQSDMTEASGGSGITLPNITPACSSDGWALYGWATSACSSETSTAPAIVGKPGDSYKPAANNTTLYAVYAKGEYTKITSTSDLNTTSKYFFAAIYSTKNYVMTSENNSNKLKAKQIDETSSGKYHAASINPEWCFTLEGGTSSWYIVDCNPNNSNHYVDTYYEAWYGHSKDDAFYFTYSAGYWTVQNVWTSGNRYFGYSSGDGAFIRSSSVQNLLIYKQTTTPSYYSTPSCCTPLGSINGSVSWSNLSPHLCLFIEPQESHKTNIGVASD